MRFIRKSLKLCFWGGLSISIAIAIFLGTCYIMGPPSIELGAATTFYDNEGDLLSPKENHETFQLDNVSPYIIDATIIIEDRHFYNHHGFDYRGIGRAVLKNVKTRHLKEGASTITQQYARNLYLTHEKTWLRKLKEAIYTIRLEMFYSKEDILTGYLHAIYYGHGAYGIEEASQLYFNKQAEDITLAEAAMLAGIPKGPTYYSPFNDEEKAKKRQELILNEMLQADLITQAEYYEAKKVTFEFDEPDLKQDIFAGHFKDTVLEEAATLIHGNDKQMLSGNYHIYTTLDSDYQRQLETLVTEHMKDDSDLELGVLSIESNTGAITGLIGGKSYESSTFNRVTDAKRMVGSTFKPFVYYAALENGYTPSTMLLSEPTTFEINDHETYEPQNYNGYYAHKPISLAQALALSDNIYAVKTNLFLNTEKVIQTTKQFNITEELPNVPSLPLGSASIPLFEMVQAYSILANEGKNVQAHTITKIENSAGEIIYSRKPSQDEQILDPAKTFVLNYLMMGMFDRRLNGYMDVTGASIIDQLTHTYAGKSGTTDTDNWMIGYSPLITTGVWTGFDDNRPLQKASEKSLAKQIWAQAIESAHEDKEDASFEVPPGIEKAIIDPQTGLLATSDCPIRRATYFETGTAPTEYCTEHSSHKTEPKKQQEKNLFDRLFELIN